MKYQWLLWGILAVVCVVPSCKKDDGNNVVDATQDEWIFPDAASTTRHGVTLYTSATGVKVGQVFDVQVILYGFSGAFGAAVELSFESSRIDVSELFTGPFLGPDSTLLVVKEIHPLTGQVAAGITQLKGSKTSVGRNGVLVKLKCVARSSGTTSIRIIGQTLAIRNQSGSSLIQSNVSLENLTLTIQ